MANRLQLDRFLPYRLSIASNLVSNRIAREYEALFGLTIPEWRLITVVAEAGPITQAELGERTYMDKVTVSRAAIALVGRGLLVRSPNEGDRRSHLLSLTGEGGTLYAAVAPKALEIEERLFSRFDEGELEVLMALLRRIDAAVLEER
jgi:DNA-binding MarR family transcriptional regulator